MIREEVRILLGDFKEFKKNQFSRSTADSFAGGGVHVFYSEDGLISGVEIFRGVEATFRSLELFSMGFYDLISALRQAGVGVVLDDVGASLVDVGLGIYAPNYEDDGGCVIDAVYVDMNSQG